MLSAVPHLPRHRAHDYRFLRDEWKTLAQTADLKMSVFAKAGGTEVFHLRSKAAMAGELAVYLSAGVHGDEPAATLGLLDWAKKHIRHLKTKPFWIFPCLNPHGLVNNTRVDHRGLDLNRRFHLRDDEVCGPWYELLRGAPLQFSLCLHEDYDAQGIYVYELSHLRAPVSRGILAQCSRPIPTDPRKAIDGRKASDGVIRRTTIPPDLPGMPEAIELHLLGCPVTLTFETPSEFSLDQRAKAQSRFIEAAVSQLCRRS